jgi:hypothetical protein
VDRLTTADRLVLRIERDAVLMYLSRGVGTAGAWSPRYFISRAFTPLMAASAPTYPSAALGLHSISHDFGLGPQRLGQGRFHGKHQAAIVGFQSGIGLAEILPLEMFHESATLLQRGYHVAAIAERCLCRKEYALEFVGRNAENAVNPTPRQTKGYAGFFAVHILSAVLI